jgi:type I restriction enzyme R subunit
LEIFGRYIHTYKFNEGVKDGIVLDLVYEVRDIDQRLSSKKRIDQWFEAKTKKLNDYQKSALKKRWGTMREVLSSRSRMEKIVSDVEFDFTLKPRLNSELGNAMLVAYSIYEATGYFKKRFLRANVPLLRLTIRNLKISQKKILAKIQKPQSSLSTTFTRIF